MVAKEIALEITAPMRAVRIIALSKTDGGIRPIGIGEIRRRAITKTLAEAIKNDVKIAIGSIQCAGLPGACEAAIKATEEAYQGGKQSLYLMRILLSITYPAAKPYSQPAGSYQMHINFSETYTTPKPTLSTTARL